MKKPAIYSVCALFLVLLVLSIVYGAEGTSSINFLSKGLADNLYCAIDGGNCNNTYLVNADNSSLWYNDSGVTTSVQDAVTIPRNLTVGNGQAYLNVLDNSGSSITPVFQAGGQGVPFTIYAHGNVHMTDYLLIRPEVTGYALLLNSSGLTGKTWWVAGVAGLANKGFQSILSDYSSAFTVGNYAGTVTTLSVNSDSGNEVLMTNTDVSGNMCFDNTDCISSWDDVNQTWNIFDQSLNTTDDVKFNNINSTFTTPGTIGTRMIINDTGIYVIGT